MNKHSINKKNKKNKNPDGWSIKTNLISYNYITPTHNSNSMTNDEEL